MERNYEGDFEKTDIKQFMDEYFSKEILTSRDLRYEKHRRKEGQRPGIRVGNINIVKIQEILTEDSMELKESCEERTTDKIKVKIK